MTTDDEARLYAAALYGITSSSVGARLDAHDRAVIANSVVDALVSRGCAPLPPSAPPVCGDLASVRGD